MLKYKSVVYLTAPKYSAGLKKLQEAYLRKAGLNPDIFRFRCLSAGGMKKIGKRKFTFDESKIPAFNNALNKLRPDFIVVQDRASLGFITNKYISLALTRGGLHKWTRVDGQIIPVLILDEPRTIKTKSYGSWLMLQDLRKLNRWLNGKQRQEPKFHYTATHSLQDVALFKNTADTALAIAIDIETTGTTIACIGYTCLMPSGICTTFVIPFYNPTKTNGCHWQTEEDEISVWQTVRQVHANSAAKAMQNGSYDSSYFITYRCPLSNYLGDTLHLSHSIWRELPKRLDFISSVALDYYRYWKDQGKEDATEDEKGYAVPTTKTGLENYWLYNALDCHSTMLDFRFLLAVIMQPKLHWAKTNYINEFNLQFGPCQSMAMRGVHVNQKLQNEFYIDLISEYDSSLTTLQTMVDDPEFNPNSPVQVRELLYRVLQAAPIARQGESTEEKILKLIIKQSSIIHRIVTQIWKTKKARNNASKYGAMKLLNSRFMYALSAAGTKNARLSSKSHHFWIGQNIQNMPKSMRVMIEADPGMLLFDIDYSQSDAYFTAFESEDQNYISTMLDPRDTHCIRAEHFFKIPYKEVYAGHKEHADWVDHPTEGVRQNTKRISYGADYLMEAYTLYVTMGPDAVVAAAKKMGYPQAASMSMKELIPVCAIMLEAYFKLYPTLPDWLQEEITKAISIGSRATSVFGNTRTFFGDLRNNKAVQRDFAAFWGQGGTAGNINKALLNIYYESQIEREGVMLLFQVHDSIVGQIPETRLDLIPEIQKLMENEIVIKKRKFVVPTEASLGFGWGKRMVDVDESTTLHSIETHERNWWKKRRELKLRAASA